MSAGMRAALRRPSDEEFYRAHVGGAGLPKLWFCTAGKARPSRQTAPLRQVPTPRVRRPRQIPMWGVLT